MLCMDQMQGSRTRCICMYRSVCAFVYVHKCVRVFMSLCAPVYVHEYMYVCEFMSVSASVCV